MWVENYVRVRRVNLSLESSCDIAYLWYHSISPLHLYTVCRHRVNIILSIIQGNVSFECDCDTGTFTFYNVYYTCFVSILRYWTTCVTSHFGRIHYPSAIFWNRTESKIVHGGVIYWFCLTGDPKTLPKQVLHRLLSSASSCNI